MKLHRSVLPASLFAILALGGCRDRDATADAGHSPMTNPSPEQAGLTDWPRIDSAIKSDPASEARVAEIGIADPKRFADIVRAAFGQRRKTLRNALGGTCTAEEIAAAGVDPQIRAERLEVADFVRLANLAPSTD